MAIAASAVWRIRAGGNDANGGGYDGTSYGGGTDYSQQDTAQLSAADFQCSNTTTLTKTAGAFTSAMVGNAIWLTGGGATAGPYFITAFGSSTSVTLDRAPGTIVNGSGKVGGAWASLPGNINSTNIKPGNIVFIRAGGSGSVSSPDYTITGFITAAPGDTTNGYAKYIGENGRPYIKANSGAGLVWYCHGVSYARVENMYLIANGTSNATGTLGVACSDGNPSAPCMFKDLVVDQNGNDVNGIICGNSPVIDCEVFSSTANSGTAGGGAGIASNKYASDINGCNVHDCWGIGVAQGDSQGTLSLANSIVAKNRGAGVVITSSLGTTYVNSIVNCTIDANVGDGIKLTDGTSLASVTIAGNIISNHTTGGTYGINCAAGTQAQNDRIRGFVDYNSYYNNTNNTHNLTVGTSVVGGSQLHDNVGTDPQYAAQSTEGYQIGTNLKALGYPQGAFPQSKASQTATQSYSDPGAVQRQESGGTTVIVPNITRNIYMTEEQADASQL